MEVKKGLPDRNGVKVGYKQTEVGVIPEDWEVKKLNTICDVRDGTHESPKYLDDGVTFITSKNIINGKIDFSDVTLISKNDAININKRSKVNKGDILMSMIGTIGNSVLIDFEPDFCIKNVALFKPQKVLGRFFIQLLYSLFYQTYINGKLDGGIQKFISLGVMREFDVPLPPTKAEQTAIATALSDADALIQSLEKLIAKKRLIKQGAMQELLKPKEGWVVKKLGEIFSITAGGDLRKDEFSSVNDEKYCYPIYSNALTIAGLYGYCSSYDHYGNCITVTARGTVGFANSRDHKFSAIGRLLILKPIEKLNCVFIAEYINLKVEFANESTGVPQLTAPQISKYEVVIPDYTEQTRIATILSDMDAEISALESKLAKYKHVKQGMMQNLLTGKIRLV